MVKRFAYESSRLLARLIARLPLNRVTLITTGQYSIYRKERYWYAPLLIASATLCQPRFQVLSGCAWHHWECAVYQQIYADILRIHANTIDLPARPGLPLIQILAAHPPSHQAIAAIQAALTELIRIQQMLISMPDQSSIPFSHGDATIANVTYHAKSGRAYWFDFETAHPANRSHPWRCADDLRALIFSAAALLDPDQYKLLPDLLITYETRRPVLAAFAQQLTELCQRPDSLHLAQTNISYEQQQALMAILMQKLYNQMNSEQ